MRKVWSKWMAVAVIAIGAMATSAANAQGSISLQVFYDELQPYGTWIDHGRYGYVWMPGEGSDFVPYGTNGYWVQTGYGNTWVSNYSWGWAPFHYGRWFYDDFYGWLWVPDTTWGPAWVTWRSGGGYYGWAPLMPGLAVSMSVGYYNQIPHNYWNFVPYRYVMYRQVYRHCVPRPHVVNVINHTTVIVNNNYYNGEGSHGSGRHDGRDRADYFTGPSRSEIEKRNGERIPTYEIHDRNRPGQTEVSRSSVSMYKPAVENSGRTRALPAQYTRDNAQGRENITEMRSRQSFERGTTDSYNENRNRDAIRRNDGSLPRGDRSFDRSNWNTSPNTVPDNTDNLRRDERQSPAVQQQRRLMNESDWNNESRTKGTREFERTNRDADFNNLQREREASEQQRQMRDVQQRQQTQRDEQMQRYREQREQGEREQSQRFQQREQREQMQRSDQQQMQRQRQYEAPRQAPARESGGVQRTTREVQQQRFAPSQRSDQQRMNTPQQRNSGQQSIRPSNSRSSSSPRSRN